MKLRDYSHLGGKAVVPKTLVEGVRIVLLNADPPFTKGAAPDIRETVLPALRNRGWSKPVKVDVEFDLTMTGVKDEVALCWQTGNASRLYADLLKLQYLYLKDKAGSAIYIVPTRRAAKKLGANLASFERLVGELELFRHIITIPMVVIGLEDQGNEAR